MCYGGPVSGCILHVESGPILAFIRGDSEASTGGMKSWGWSGEEEFVPFIFRTGSSITARVEKAAVGHWVPELVIAGVDAKMLMLSMVLGQGNS